MAPKSRYHRPEASGFPIGKESNVTHYNSLLSTPRNPAKSAPGSDGAMGRKVNSVTRLCKEWGTAGDTPITG
ncbi:uncharacterized protein N7511_010973 [Penicillium nucicola]|uniref:uncharacterized protein n=1 Tax=Penicillium nucicola TaxID=1850975 RepID=UPI002545AE3D|nr:uncharacterized protein N7511_010973 [Penicillium nucicola]KAJ5749277.1 hypothetical protein N7511_010973 [Penicillium nucicola]